MMHANDREEVKEVFAGDIAAAVGIKQVDDRRHAGGARPPDQARDDRCSPSR